MADEEEDKKPLSPEKLAEIVKIQEKFRAEAQKLRDDPKSREMVQDFVEMNAASYESEQMPEGEGFARGLFNMLVGTFGKGDRARRAKNRGMGFLTNHMFKSAMKKNDGEPEEKLEVSPEEMTKAFNEEMERQEVPVAAKTDGENIEISRWDTDEKDDGQ